jgi:hypothetical protein
MSPSPCLKIRVPRSHREVACAAYRCAVLDVPYRTFEPAAWSRETINALEGAYVDAKDELHHRSLSFDR